LFFNPYKNNLSNLVVNNLLFIFYYVKLNFSINSYIFTAIKVCGANKNCNVQWDFIAMRCGNSEYVSDAIL